MLRRHHTKPSDRDRDIETQSHTAYKGQRFDTDLEPIYQEQNVSKSYVFDFVRLTVVYVSALANMMLQVEAPRATTW